MPQVGELDELETFIGKKAARPRGARKTQGNARQDKIKSGCGQP